jgi:hypothetical protein
MVDNKRLAPRIVENPYVAILSARKQIAEHSLWIRKMQEERRVI